VYRKVGESGRLGVDGELATTPSRFTKCGFVSIVENVQEEEEEDVSLAQTSLYIIFYLKTITTHFVLPLLKVNPSDVFTVNSLF